MTKKIKAKLQSWFPVMHQGTATVYKNLRQIIMGKQECEFRPRHGYSSLTNAMPIKLIKKVLSYIIIVTNIHQYSKTMLWLCLSWNVVLTTEVNFIQQMIKFLLLGKEIRAEISGMSRYRNCTHQITWARQSMAYYSTSLVCYISKQINDS